MPGYAACRLPHLPGLQHLAQHSSAACFMPFCHRNTCRGQRAFTVYTLLPVKVATPPFIWLPVYYRGSNVRIIGCLTALTACSALPFIAVAARAGSLNLRSFLVWVPGLPTPCDAGSHHPSSYSTDASWHRFRTLFGSCSLVQRAAPVGFTCRHALAGYCL